MVDSALRELERALAGGDELARPPLALAYLRRAQPAAALRLLAPRLDAPCPDADLEQRAWRQALARLRPAARVPGPASYGRLVGWFGGGRYAALSLEPGLRVFDLQARAAVRPQDAPPQLEPLATAADALYCRRNAQALRLRPSAAAWESEPLPFPGLPQQASPDGAWVAVAAHAGAPVTLHQVTGEAPGRRLPGGPYALDWGRGRAVWRCPTGVSWGDLAGRDPPQTIALSLPARAAETFGLLADGRLVVGPPLTVIDLDRVGPARPLTRGEATGPLRLSLDRAALLCREGGAPTRLPLVGSARAAPPAEAPGDAELRWHPRADVVAWAPAEGQPELRAVLPGRPRPRALLRLPTDARPLGWTPDGLGLLVVRRLSTDGAGALELWACGGGDA